VGNLSQDIGCLSRVRREVSRKDHTLEAQLLRAITSTVDHLVEIDRLPEAHAHGLKLGKLRCVVLWIQPFQHPPHHDRQLLIPGLCSEPLPILGHVHRSRWPGGHKGGCAGQLTVPACKQSHLHNQVHAPRRLNEPHDPPASKLRKVTHRPDDHLLAAILDGQAVQRVQVLQCDSRRRERGQCRGAIGKDRKHEIAFRRTAGKLRDARCPVH